MHMHIMKFSLKTVLIGLIFSLQLEHLVKALVNKFQLQVIQEEHSSL